MPKKSDDEIEWIEFDPENDPRIKKIETGGGFNLWRELWGSRSDRETGNGCGWLILAFFIFVLLMMCAGLLSNAP